MDGNRLNGEIRLRAMKVSQNTLNRYLLSIQQFEDWALAHKKPKSGKQLDRSVNAYLTHLCESGAEVSEGTYLVYGLQLLRCDVSKTSFLPISKQSLSGWRKQNPGRMRMPVPEEFVFDVATLALEEGQLEIALVMAIQLDGYLRPSECLNLTKDNMGAPQGARYPHWTILLAPAMLGQVTKTGKSDDSVLLGDLRHNSWIRDCLKIWMRKVEHQLFQNVNLAQYEQFCRRACSTLQYRSACVMPHIIRHAGPSNDIYHKRRSLVEVQKRGRWATKSSVTRYEKHAMLHTQWKQISPGRKLAATKRSQTFPRALLEALRADG